MENEQNDYQEILKNLKTEDFDGHSEFHKLTVQQKLEWLSQAVIFYYKYGNWGKDSRFYIEKNEQ